MVMWEFNSRWKGQGLGFALSFRNHLREVVEDHVDHKTIKAAVDNGSLFYFFLLKTSELIEGVADFIGVFCLAGDELVGVVLFDVFDQREHFSLLDEPAIDRW